MAIDTSADMTMVMTMVLSIGINNMESIKASEFKAKCLRLMDEVARTGDSLVITKNGTPVAMLAPYSKKRASLAGLHRGAVEILGDIVSPIDEPWEAGR